MLGEDDHRGSDDPKPEKPSGDDPRSGTEVKSLIHSDVPKRNNGPTKPKQ